MHGPMPKCETPASHVIAQRSPVSLAFCFLSTCMTSSSTQVSANVRALNSFELTSCVKASSPLVYSFLLMPSTFQPFVQSGMWTPSMLISFAHQSLTNAMRGTPQLLVSPENTSSSLALCSQLMSPPSHLSTQSKV